MQDDSADPALTDLTAALETARREGSRSERAIAGHFLRHLNALPFETAASVAQKIGVRKARSAASAANWDMHISRRSRRRFRPIRVTAPG